MAQLTGAFRGYATAPKKWKTEIIKYFKRAPKFSLYEWKRDEPKVAEEYCWAITQLAGRSSSGQ